MIDKRLMKLLGHTKKYIIQTVAYQWIAMLANVAMVYSFVHVMNSIYQKTIVPKEIGIAAAVMLLSIITRHICSRMSAKSAYQASKDVKQTLREKIYTKLLSIGNSYTDHVSTSELVQVSMEGVEQLEIYFGRYLPQLFYSLLAPITLFVITSFINFKASLVLFLCVPLIPMSIVAVQKFAKKLLAKYWGTYTGLGDSFLENLQGLSTLKIYSADERKSKEMDVEAEKFRKVTMKVLIMQLNSISVMDLVAFGGAAAGIIVAILEYQKGNMSFAGLFILILLSSEYFVPMRLLGSFFHIAMNGMAAGEKIFRVLNIKEDEEAVLKLTGCSEIEIKNVSFSYNNEKKLTQKQQLDTENAASRTILQNISMSIKKNQFVAIAGVSGCGKSTMAKLLAGENTSYEGSITMDGMEVSKVKKDSLKKNVTLVNHNGYLFTGTVRENLCMGKQDASEEEMWNVLRKVKLEAFLLEEAGLDTVLKEQASNLSGGQRQRLVIARALLHDTPVYIFDEATSNIDVESEEDIVNLIHELLQKKTIIMISHRLANITKADQIYLLEEGYIKESGTHEELMKKNGSYNHMYSTQKELEAYRNEDRKYA